jgi:hypothetical protein
MTTVLWVNKNTNIVDNASLDDKPIDEIVLPEPYFALDQTTTLAIKFYYDEELKEVVSAQGLGAGGIGFTWDGEKLIGPQPIIPETSV